MGFLGTWVGRRLIGRFGLLRAGTQSLAIQASLLGLATAIYAVFLSGPGALADAAAQPLLGPGGGGMVYTGASWGVFSGLPVPVLAFALLIVLSRLGIWSFDMVNAQLFQQTVSQREVAAASSAEMALCRWGVGQQGGVQRVPRLALFDCLVLPPPVWY